MVASLLPLLMIMISCIVQSGPDSFRFAFLTDIHVQPESRATEGYTAAIDHVNQLRPRPDFVITGGDLIMDALGQTFGRADSLYALFIETTKLFRMDVYHCIGNHENFGVYTSSGISPDHPEYGKKMFENRLGDGRTYRSFDYEGWHFVLLDGIGFTEERRYIGEIDEAQIEWLRADLENTGYERPVVLALHIPFYTIWSQMHSGSLAANSRGTVITNAAEVWEVCSPYNVKLVLQGHLHVVEEIVWKGTHFITGGAVSAAWWRGPHAGFEEGYVLVDVHGNDFDWTYEDYGWEVETTLP